MRAHLLFLTLTAACALAGSPAPRPAGPPPLPTPVPRPATTPEKLLADFRPLVGLRETPLGSNRGPQIDAWNRAANVPLGSPWCAAVASYFYGKHGLPARGAYSPSWFSRARAVPISDVQPGDIALVWFPSKGRYAHTIAAIESIRRVGGRPVEVVTLEGNTNAQGSREGDGFFRRVRKADGLTFVRWWK